MQPAHVAKVNLATWCRLTSQVNVAELIRYRIDLPGALNLAGGFGSALTLIDESGENLSDCPNL
jgi:hypothetical protein